MNVKNIINEINLSGVVRAYKIEKAESKMMWDDERNGRKKGDPVTQYRGFIMVQTGENQFASVRVQKIEGFYDGKPDFTTQALEQMANNEVATFVKTRSLTETPTISIYRGVKLVDNVYVKDGQEAGGLQVDLGFGSISLGEPTEEPRFRNELTISGVIKGIDEEVVNDEPTGRAKVKVLMPYTYGSEKKGTQVIRAVSLTLVAGEIEDEEGIYDLGADLLDYGDELIDTSWIFYSELNGYSVETEQKPKEEDEEPAGRRFGRQRQTVETRSNFASKQEYLMVGLAELEGDNAFDEEEMNDAKRERERFIAEKIKEEEEKQGQAEAARPAPGRLSGRERVASPAGERAGRSRTRNFS